MRKEASLPVRLNPDEKRRLQKIAEKTGHPVSALIRELVKAFVEYYERNGGRVTMPLDGDDVFGKSQTAVGTAAEKPISYLKRKPRPDSKK